MARKCKRERDKRAGGKVRQQEPRAPSHYDSSSSCMSPGVDCKPQSPRPDRETGETVEDHCESGCTWRGGLQQRGPAHEAKTWSCRFTVPVPAVSVTISVSAGTAAVHKKRRNQVWESCRNVLEHFVIRWIIRYVYTCKFCYPPRSDCYQMTVRMMLSWEEAQPWT